MDEEPVFDVGDVVESTYGPVRRHRGKVISVTDKGVIIQHDRRCPMCDHSGDRRFTKMTPECALTYWRHVPGTRKTSWERMLDTLDD